MQKNYRDFTIGELLDLGLEVQLYKHGLLSVEEAKKQNLMFEGTKQSTKNLRGDVKVVHAWKGKFKCSAFVVEHS
ncbi:hypothetical protein QU593_10130 [Rossellomorea marisflavi]|uniref:hypothetical protein n=1 Tax=Rossellomorea marisflavi TaxID=189381 RepID=UPI0025B19ABD|nr:hypothetical protein [Rossellomorea marisflavi]WJV20762.1 hypothetical protein QU593_10130 [Rossellomorea marisflavi]